MKKLSISQIAASTKVFFKYLYSVTFYRAKYYSSPTETFSFEICRHKSLYLFVVFYLGISTEYALHVSWITHGLRDIREL